MQKTKEADRGTSTRSPLRMKLVAGTGAAFQQHLQASHIPPAQPLIVLAATGSYWVALAVTLHDAGYAVAVLNPAQLHK